MDLGSLYQKSPDLYPEDQFEVAVRVPASLRKFELQLQLAEKSVLYNQFPPIKDY
jgi:hypothetical protein